VSLARALEPLERKAAKQRHKEHSGRPSKTTGKFPAVSPARAKDKIAAAVGVDRKTLAKAESVVAAAEAEPETFGTLREKVAAVDGIDLDTRREQCQRQLTALHDELRAVTAALPRGKRCHPWDRRHPWLRSQVDIEREIAAVLRALDALRHV
jgi:hypothetical protein